MHNIAEDAHENRFSDVYAKIQAEIDRATSAEETLDKKIEDEVDRAETSESALDDKIEAETQRATSAETQLQNNITAETNRATAKENELSAAITAEQQRAEQAEQQITNAVNTEVQNRTAAVTEERERAIAAENAITENMTNLVDTEKDRAIAAENSIRTDMTNLVETEKDRAIAAEGNLQSQFNNWEAQLDGVEAKVDGKQDKIGAVQGNATDMEITGIPATNSIAFKGENGDFLAIKTKNPTSSNDAVSKASLDTEVERINNNLDEKQDKIGQVRTTSGTNMQITGIPVSKTIGFRGTSASSEFLNVKTGTPSANDDSATKKYVDDAITSATNLNWKEATLTFYNSSNSNVSTGNIRWAEDNNFVYVYFDVTISNCQVNRATATLDTLSIAAFTESSALSYTLYGEGIKRTVSFTFQCSITPNAQLVIAFADAGNIDVTNKYMHLFGTYLFNKNNESTI